jgi:phospholipid/cholesterol/gamma-HCH transport system substrate-binding protein
MKRSSFLTWDQLKVGTIVLVSFAILLFGVYKLGQSANLFATRYQLVTFLPSANGLRAGGSVTIAGQLAGTVKTIEFLPVDGDTTRNLRVVFEVDERLREQIRGDSRARLRTLGLLGDKVFDISPGTVRFPVLAANDTVPIGESTDYDQVIAQASSAVEDVVQLSQDLRTITGGIVKGEGTVGQLVTNRALYDELTGTLERTNQLIGRMQNPNGTVGRLIDDPTLYRNLSGAIASVDSLVRAVNSSQGTVGKLLRDDSLYTRMVSVAAGADSLVKLTTSGNGLASKLLNDQEVYDKLNKTLTDLNEILADVRRNPGKYTKGLIKVF